MCIRHENKCMPKELEFFHLTLDFEWFEWIWDVFSQQERVLAKSPALHNNDNKQTPLTTMENYTWKEMKFSIFYVFSIFTHIALVKFLPAPLFSSFGPTTIEYHILPFFFLRFSFSSTFHTSPNLSPWLYIYIPQSSQGYGAYDYRFAQKHVLKKL